MGEEPIKYHVLLDGKFIGAGVTGTVALHANGHIRKVPWENSEWRKKECVEAIDHEAKIYRFLQERFGNKHKSFVEFRHFDENQHWIELEYMPNGDLRSYLQKNKSRIARAQRLRWCLAATEGLMTLHSIGVVHRDYRTDNMLLDKDLGLKIIDLETCTIEKHTYARGTSVPSIPLRWGNKDTATVHEDLVSLGLAIYEISTGLTPFEGFDFDCIDTLRGLKQFPDLCGLELRDIIRDCWCEEATSAQKVYERLKILVEHED